MMAKYKREILERIFELLASDSYTVQEVCDLVGISRSTFYKWEREKKQFAHLLKNAKKELEASMIAEAKRSLRKKIAGYDVEETRIVLGRAKEGGQPTVKEKVITKKHVAPDTGAIIFFLTNKLPSEFQNRYHHGGNISLEKRVSGLSEEHLNALIDNVLADE